MKNPLVSVVIPVYNEHQVIAACLQSLCEQTYPNLEIIIIDDGSSDDTVKTITRFDKHRPSKKPAIKLFHQPHLGPGQARNLGAQKAKGTILVFIDADMTFDKKFINALTKPIRQGQDIGTFSKQEFVANRDNPWAEAWSLLRGFQAGRMHPGNYPDTQSVFRAIASQAFRQVGGFDTTFGYDDDWSLSKRLGRLANHAPGAIFYHSNPDSPGEIFTQSKWMATRSYKFGLLGKFAALTRASLPISLIRSLYLIFKHKKITLFFAALISDFGVCIGILTSLFGRKTK